MSPRSATQRAAQLELAQLLGRIQTRAGTHFPRAWRVANSAEVRQAGALGKEANPPPSVSWRTDLALEARGAVAAEQRRGLSELAAASFTDLRLHWNDYQNSPGELTGIGFVRREQSPLQVWESFYAANRAAFDAVYSIGPDDALNVVRQHDIDETTIIYVQRLRSGVPVEGQRFAVHVTHEGSSVGNGIVWLIDAQWDRDLPARMPAAPRSAWIDEAAALAAAAPPGVTPRTSDLVIVCGEQCRPTWRVDVRDDLAVDVDAVTGVVAGSYDPRGFAGPIRLGGYPPGATAITPIAFRNANFRDRVTHFPVGASDWDTGTYTPPGVPVLVGHDGDRRMFVGRWLPGRVDRRGPNFGDELPLLVDWDPASEPTRDFGSPNAWPSCRPARSPPCSGNLEHMSSVLYGWLSYWQWMFANPIAARVADTVSYRFGIDFTGPGLGGGAAGSWNIVAPGSNQRTWGRMSLGAGDFDSPFDPAQPAATRADQIMSTMSLASHEYAHTVYYCNASTRPLCTFANSAPGGTRPPDVARWRREVWGAAHENLPNMFAMILTQYRSVNYSGGESYNADWNYGGYASRTDSFGTAIQSAVNLTTDCTLAGVGCPARYACVPTTDYNPILNMRGVCAPICNPAPCDPGLVCGTPSGVPAGTSVCWHYDYYNAWFTTMGGRLAFDLGWRQAFHHVLVAAEGTSGNLVRDFTLGPNNWYDQLVRAGWISRYEVGRAVRSVSSESGVTARDDYPTIGANAVAIPVPSDPGERINIQFGNSALGFPYLDPGLDIDVVMFRGVRGARYVIEAEPQGQSRLDMEIQLATLSDPAGIAVSEDIPIGDPRATLTTPVLADDWYIVRFYSRNIEGGEWVGSIRLAQDSDEFGDNTAEAYPMMNGAERSGQVTPGDVDAFRIYVPAGGDIPPRPVALSVFCDSPTVAIEVLRPDGTPALPPGSLRVDIPRASDDPGEWTWRLSGNGTYRTFVGLDCRSCDRSGIPTRDIAQPWGDRLGGRLAANATARFSVILGSYEGASFALSDSDPSCSLRMDLFAPPAMHWFNGQRVTRWGTGAAVGDIESRHVGVGGHIVAPIFGTYTVEVTEVAGLGCPAFRLFVARDGNENEPMPAW